MSDGGAPRGHGAFRLGELHLALPMAALREVIPRGTPMPLPCPNESVIGGVDLRGVVVPVLDLGRVLGRGPTDCARPCVIVMVFEGRLLGLLADGVSGVFTNATLKPAVKLAGTDTPLFDCCIAADDGAMVSVLSPAAIAALPQVPMVGDPESRRAMVDGAAEAPVDADLPASRPMLLMHCGRVALAIEAIAVHATLADPAVRGSALARGACRGVIDYAGAEVPAVDLLAFCRLVERGGEVPPQQAFVLALPVGKVAFLVDRIVDIVDTPPADVIALPAFALQRAELFKGVLPPAARAYATDGPPWFVIDGAALAGCDEVQGWAGVCVQGGAAAGGDVAADASTAAAAGHDMLTYELGGETATPLEQVAEILAYAPGPATWTGDGALRGVLVNRGRSIPVMCLSALTNGRPLEPSRGASVLVVESDGELVGFVVPALKAIEAAHWQPALPGGAAGRSRPLALVGRGAAERMLPVLDLWQMARTLRHENGARAH